jgi:hypothetical protein
MLSGAELALNALVVVFLLPLAVYGLWRGTPPPEQTWLARLFRHEPLLHVVENLFLIALSLTCIVRLAPHFGLMPAGWDNAAQTATDVPFLLLLVAFWGLMVRGLLRMRQAAGDGA